MVKDKYKNDGMKSICLECSKVIDKIYRNKNKEKTKNKVRNYYKKNRRYIIDATSHRNKKERCEKGGILYNKEFVFRSDVKKQDRKEDIKARKKKSAKEYNSRPEVKEKTKNYVRYKYKNNINYRLKSCLSSRIRQALTKNNIFKGKNTINLIGISMLELKKHIEFQWIDEMNWSNYGKWDGNYEKLTWHIDHIVGCNNFDLSKQEQQLICFNWKNLRPLWADKNIAKGDKIVEPMWGYDYSI